MCDWINKYLQHTLAAFMSGVAPVSGSLISVSAPFAWHILTISKCPNPAANKMASSILPRWPFCLKKRVKNGM